jgi:glyoxylase-like metal-dependent hydrolase (beta-lactamase superfamily II)
VALRPQQLGAKTIELVLLTHHHRDIVFATEKYLAQGIPVRAPKNSAEWLLSPGVTKYWTDSLPLRNSRTAYLVVPAGLDQVKCDLEDSQELSWRGWKLRVVATPGHSRDHVSFLATRQGTERILFAGDALASPGKMWSPYTTDWDHWTDMGLAPAAASLHKLAELQPTLICPAHGAPIKADCAAALKQTADAVAEVGFLKSFERFSKQRLGNAPEYEFLAKEQAATAGEKPWSQISPHLFLTGNTYVLVSKDNRIMVFDPWGKRSVDQVGKLQSDRQLGEVELVMFSHAHFDHYDGVYDLPGREKYAVWTLAEVAAPLADPLFYRAPFLDARPVKIDRRMRDGEAAAWREFTFRFHHFPGQTFFTMAVETEIDGKRCLFTADNFFHQDQFSGSGGWMGLNRSWPGLYASSAQKVLELKPQWVLAEHGGAFVFNPEDFRRRVRWGEAAGKAADALSPGGDHRRDWNPHRIHMEPLVHRARPGAALQMNLVVENTRAIAESLTIRLDGRGAIPDHELKIDVPPGRTFTEAIRLKLTENVRPGRYVIPIRAEGAGTLDCSDPFVVLEVEP